MGQQGGHRPVSSQRDEVALGECEIPRCILVHTQHLQTGQEAHAQARCGAGTVPGDRFHDTFLRQATEVVARGMRGVDVDMGPLERAGLT